MLSMYQAPLKVVVRERYKKCRECKGKKLDISHCNLIHLYPEMVDIKSLEELNVRGNLVFTLPRVVCELKNLKVLNISSCKLNELPSELWNMKGLEKLNVGGNSLGTLSRNVSNLTSLKVLDVSSCNLTRIPKELWDMEMLEELDVGMNILKKIPSDICNLKNLKKLGVYNCNLTLLPEEIGELGALEELDVGVNYLEALPSSIGKLNKLRVLVIWKCTLTSLPSGLWDLDSLEVLIAEDNPLNTLPGHVHKLKKLKKLNVSFCGLTALPPEIWNMTSLEELNVGVNSLVKLPNNVSKLKNLKVLDIYACDLAELPPELWDMGTLGILAMGANPLATLSSNIGKLKKLRKLYASRCSLISLPRELCGIDVLEELHLGENPLLDLQEGLDNLKSLVMLDVPSCRLTSLPSRILELDALEELCLKENPLEELPKVVCNLKNLKKLVISSCNLTSLPIEMGKMEALKELDVRGNPLKFPPLFLVAWNANETARDILGFLKDYSLGHKNYHSLKVYLIGDGLVGKTTLMRRMGCLLKGVAHDMESWGGSTNGIGAHDFEMQLNREVCQLRVLDFGGQMQYYDTHQLFLSSVNSLYLIVVSLAKLQDQGLRKLALRGVFNEHTKGMLKTAFKEGRYDRNIQYMDDVKRWGHVLSSRVDPAFRNDLLRPRVKVILTHASIYSGAEFIDNVLESSVGILRAEKGAILVENNPNNTLIPAGVKEVLDIVKIAAKEQAGGYFGKIPVFYDYVLRAIQLKDREWPENKAPLIEKAELFEELLRLIEKSGFLKEARDILSIVYEYTMYLFGKSKVSVESYTPLKDRTVFERALLFLHGTLDIILLENEHIVLRREWYYNILADFVYPHDNVIDNIKDGIMSLAYLEEKASKYNIDNVGLLVELLERACVGFRLRDGSILVPCMGREHSRKTLIELWEIPTNGEIIAGLQYLFNEVTPPGLFAQFLFHLVKDGILDTEIYSFGSDFAGTSLGTHRILVVLHSKKSINVCVRSHLSNDIIETFSAVRKTWQKCVSYGWHAKYSMMSISTWHLKQSPPIFEYAYLEEDVENTFPREIKVRGGEVVLEKSIMLLPFSESSTPNVTSSERARETEMFENSSLNATNGITLYDMMAKLEELSKKMNSMTKVNEELHVFSQKLLENINRLLKPLHDALVDDRIQGIVIGLDLTQKKKHQESWRSVVSSQGSMFVLNGEKERVRVAVSVLDKTPSLNLEGHPAIDLKRIKMACLGHEDDDTFIKLNYSTAWCKEEQQAYFDLNVSDLCEKMDERTSVVFVIGIHMFGKWIPFVITSNIIAMKKSVFKKCCRRIRNEINDKWEGLPPYFRVFARGVVVPLSVVALKAVANMIAPGSVNAINEAWGTVKSMNGMGAGVEAAKEKVLAHLSEKGIEGNVEEDEIKHETKLLDVLGSGAKAIAEELGTSPEVVVNELGGCILSSMDATMEETRNDIENGNHNKNYDAIVKKIYMKWNYV